MLSKQSEVLHIPSNPCAFRAKAQTLKAIQGGLET